MAQIFISHAEEDASLVSNIADALDAEGYTTWHYKRDGNPIGPIHLTLSLRAITQAEAFILLISPQACCRSTQIEPELIAAQTQGKPIIPLLRNISYEEFKKRQPTWDFILKGAVARPIAHETIASVLPYIIKGLDEFKIRPHQENVPNKERETEPKPGTFGQMIQGIHDRFKLILLVAILVLAIFLGFYFVNNHLEQRTFEKNTNSFLGAMPWLNWVIYDPTDYNPYENRYPSEASIRKDLEVLRKKDFNGLITMASRESLSQIPRIAHEVGFNMVVMGVWDLRDKEELRKALTASQYADAYCLGHRGLNKIYSDEELEKTIKAFRTKTLKPVTTSEVFGEYVANKRLAEIGDFLFPDVHTNWHKGIVPKDAWQQTLEMACLAAKISAEKKKLVLLKMVSYPSGGADGLSLETQKLFYKYAVEEARERADLPGNVTFSFLTAFDTPWKSTENDWQESEKHTGLFTVERSPKLAVTSVNWQIHRQ